MNGNNRSNLETIRQLWEVSNVLFYLPLLLLLVSFAFTMDEGNKRVVPFALSFLVGIPAFVLNIIYLIAYHRKIHQGAIGKWLSVLQVAIFIGMTLLIINAFHCYFEKIFGVTICP
jgi:hypothetical protein